MTAQHPAITDSIAVRSPVPGGIGRVLHLLFNLPQWVHVTLVVLGAALGTWGAWVAWHRRREIADWLRTRDRRAKIALAVVGVAAVSIGAGGTGYTFWYMEHENDFCLGCHVMTPSWTKFQKSEHRKLECHDCHRQSMYANARQLVLWIAERPERIPDHAKLPTQVCARCHIQAPGADSTWKRIVATAGHRVHLASKDTALKNVQCVTCHGVEVHAFQPVDKTCAQSGCHTDEKSKIVLGKMAGQTSLHCTGCHQFTRPVAEHISVDSTKQVLRPASNQCLGCHEMRRKMQGFDPTADKHAGLCGNCHNPHRDKTPDASWKTCGTAGCHTAPLEETPFHNGISPKAITQCASCHQAHTWKADGAACLTCHQDITRRGAAPVAQSVARDAHRSGEAAGFDHAAHRNESCGSCHSSDVSHGALTVKTRADCQSCHHAADRTRACEGCHRKASLSAPRTISAQITLTVAKAPRERTQTFRHPQHRELECVACHTKGVELAVTTTCASCHTEHHEVTRDCRSCHVGVKAQHERSVHQGCGACHRGAEWQALPTARNVCLSCHVEMSNHKRGGECADCHKMTTWSVSAGSPKAN